MAVHVVPVNDLRQHTLSALCWCAPRVDWRDPETGEHYRTPMITHNAADHREIVEDAMKLLGYQAPSDPGKLWKLIEWKGTADD